MFSRHNRMISAFYLCADVLLALMSFWLAWEIRSYLITPRPLYSISNYRWIVPLSVGVWILVGLAAGIYREINEEDWRRAFTDPLKVGLMATILLFAATFAIKFQYLSRLLLVLYASTDLVTMTLFRLVARRFAEDLGGACQACAISCLSDKGRRRLKSRVTLKGMNHAACAWWDSFALPRVPPNNHPCTVLILSSTYANFPNCCGST